MAAIMGAAAAMALVGGASNMYTQRKAAQAQQRAAKYQSELAKNRAVGLEQQANVEAAISQRVAINQRRLGRNVRSDAIAAAAASGRDPSGVGVTNILGDIDLETEMRALTALYQGESAERALLYGADLERAESRNLRYAGGVAKTLGYAQAYANALSSGSNAAAMGYDAYTGYTGRRTTTTDNKNDSGTALYQRYGGGGYSGSNRYS